MSMSSRSGTVSRIRKSSFLSPEPTIPYQLAGPNLRHTKRIPYNLFRQFLEENVRNSKQPGTRFFRGKEDVISEFAGWPALKVP